MKSKWKTNRDEILWNLITSGLAGILVLLGNLTSGTITRQGIGAALIVSAIVTITQFKDYWKREEKEYVTKMFNFVGA